MDEYISDTISPQQQGWKRVVTGKLGDHKVRITIDRDSYDFQSHIFSEVWSPVTLSWNTVERRAGQDYKDLPGAYTLSNGKDTPVARYGIEIDTEPLFDEMVEYVRAILV